MVVVARRTLAKVPRPQRRKRVLARVRISALLFGFALVSACVSSQLFGERTTTTAATHGPVSKSETTHALHDKADAPSVYDDLLMACETNFTTTADKVLWVVVYVLATLYVFLGLAIVCDDFFVSSLEVICDELDLTPDVAGATFMAAGSSAPELFTSVVGVFVERNDVGVGTILGSAVFNILVIIGLTALLAGQVLQLDWKPLARDSLFYMFSILLILVMFSNKQIDWYEAAILLVSYALYLVIMKYNAQLMAFLDRVASGDRSAELSNQSQGPDGEAEQEEKKAGGEGEGEEDDDDDNDLFAFPDTTKDQLLWVLALPLLALFKLTIPDCSKPESRKYYVVTFVMSIVHIGLACFFMADWARSLGCILGISPAIMGLTLLAAGTSVPDALSSLFVAQDGEGDMAVSNAIGSNVFDILLGLGLPWMTAICIHGGVPVAVKSEGVVKATVLLFVVLVFVIGTLVLSGWKLSPRVGAAMFAMYFVFVIFSLLDQYFDLVSHAIGS